MAHYLSTLDTTARYISVPTVTLVGDFVIEWRGAIVTNGIFAFAGGVAGTNGIDLYRNNSGKYQLLINTQSQVVSTVNASNSASSPDIVRIERVGSVFTLYVNSVSQGNFSLTPPDVKIQRIFHREGWGTYGNQALYSLAITGSDPRNYDANASGGTGNILPETISALNGTQAGTWPGDNSEWIEYSTGGTAPTGTVTIGTITPNSTGASVPFTYSAADQTGFEYQLNETGTIYPISASPATPTGLAPSTGYTIRVRAKNDSGEGAWSTSAPFTTSAAGSPPAGTFTVGTITTTQTTASVPYTYSAADQTSIEYRVDGGAAVTASASPQALSGLTAGTTYGIQFRAVSGFGNGAWSTSASFTTASVPVGTITLTGLANNTATLWSGLSGISCTVMNEAATSIVVTKTGLTANAGGDVTFNDAAITASTWYTVVIVSGTNRGIIRIQAT